MTAPITASQVRAIHTARSAAGVDRETYERMLDEGWGAKSCTDLNIRDASELLRRLGVPKPKRRPRGRPPARLPAGVVRMVTASQRRLIDDLRAELGLTEAALATWLERSQRLTSVRTSAEATRVIEGLRAWKGRR